MPAPLVAEPWIEALAQARRQRRLLPAPALAPLTRAQAYHVQQCLLSLLGEARVGWKVGTCDADDGVCGAPLPASALKRPGSPLEFAPNQVVGLEVELAFRLTDLARLASEPLPEAVFLREGIRDMALAVEAVSSRWAGWPDVPEGLKLADLQNHGALLLGQPIAYDPEFPFLAPQVELMVAGQNRAKCPAANPAGDPRRLLQPFIRQCQHFERPIGAEDWITTGSYSGICFAEWGATRAHAMIEGLGEVGITLE